MKKEVKKSFSIDDFKNAEVKKAEQKAVKGGDDLGTEEILHGK